MKLEPQGRFLSTSELTNSISVEKYHKLSYTAQLQTKLSPISPVQEWILRSYKHWNKWYFHSWFLYFYLLKSLFFLYFHPSPIPQEELALKPYAPFLSSSWFISSHLFTFSLHLQWQSLSSRINKWAKLCQP